MDTRRKKNLSIPSRSGEIYITSNFVPDSEIEWRTSPGLEIKYIILKHKLQEEFTVAIYN